MDTLLVNWYICLLLLFTSGKKRHSDRKQRFPGEPKTVKRMIRGIFWNPGGKMSLFNITVELVSTCRSNTAGYLKSCQTQASGFPYDDK